MLPNSEKCNVYLCHFRYVAWRLSCCTCLCPLRNPLPYDLPEVSPEGLVILALALDLHPETGLVVVGSAGGLNVVAYPGSESEDRRPGLPVEGSWQSKTLTMACGPEVTQAGWQGQEQTGHRNWAWWIWLWGAGPSGGKSALSPGGPSEGGKQALEPQVWSIRNMTKRLTLMTTLFIEIYFIKHL